MDLTEKRSLKSLRVAGVRVVLVFIIEIISGRKIVAQRGQSFLLFERSPFANRMNAVICQAT